jgi:putative ABC transport system ATP-binding protein
MALITIQGLVKDYKMGANLVRALDHVDLVVEPNEYLAIMGPSGSGKSTLMNLIGCLDTPTAGTYNLNGRDVSRMNDNELAAVRNRDIGFVFQTFNLLPRATAYHNVELPLVYGRMRASQRRQRTQEAIDAVGLSDRAHHKPNELSGGQRQRVAIARALVTHPALILADEPTGNLDTRTGEEIMQIFDNIHAAGNTIIMVTHEADIARHCKRVVRLRDGKVEIDTTAEEAFSQAS